MKKIADKLTDLIGGTPLLRLNAYSEAAGLRTPLIAKLEAFNPAGSAKDRVALSMIEDAERRGAIKPGATIIEPTSGNTGVGLAMVSAVKGYKLILTMPDNMSMERRNLVKAYGAQVVLTPAAQGMSGAIAKAEELRDSIPGSIILQQFENPANPAAHYRTTAEEIWRDTDGRVDALVAGVGTGGTLCGTGRRLLELNPQIEVVGVEPDTSAVLSGEKAGRHKLQGIGAGFVPKIYDASVVSRIIKVSGDDAYRASRLLASTEGLLAGISAGAALCGAGTLAKDAAYAGKSIVVVIPDTGERYLSTDLFADK